MLSCKVYAWFLQRYNNWSSTVLRSMSSCNLELNHSLLGKFSSRLTAVNTSVQVTATPGYFQTLQKRFGSGLNIWLINDSRWQGTVLRIGDGLLAFAPALVSMTTMVSHIRVIQLLFIDCSIYWKFTRSLCLVSFTKQLLLSVLYLTSTVIRSKGLTI